MTAALPPAEAPPLEADLIRVGAPRASAPVRLNISIINYRTTETTLRCLEALLEALAGLDVRISLVDNASGDGSAERLGGWIAALPPPASAQVTLIHSRRNTGFSGGHNIGMGAQHARFHLILNSDALVRPGAVQALLAAAEANPDAALLAPRLEWEDGTPQISAFRHHSPLSELIRGAGSGPVTRLLRRWDVPLPFPPDPSDIEWVSFACVLLRAEAAEQVGPMDEGYFLYFEDADHCARLTRAGWRILPVPEARVVHLRGGSAPVKSLAAERKRLPPYWYASRTRLLRRLHGRAGPLAANLAWHLGRGLAQFRRLVGKPVPPANAYEARDIWTNILDPLGDACRPTKDGTGRSPRP